MLVLRQVVANKRLVFCVFDQFPVYHKNIANFVARSGRKLCKPTF